ncbi:zinc finger protein 1035 [Clupea harengus]|uniref:Zinc finger protein 1035 n=1 Tax=Clupea harengus TaxID=7950 RepID=A0A6P3VJB3_CLUHA|nr:zinc finger protein 1035 [Clupea harengus]XP_031432515.1 zinc finger protein 1035 [Clupea harengus]
MFMVWPLKGSSHLGCPDSMTHEGNTCGQTQIPDPMALGEPQDPEENMEVQADGFLKQENNHTSGIYQETTHEDFKTDSDTTDLLKDGDGTAFTPTKSSLSGETGRDFDVDQKLQDPKDDPHLLTPDIPDGYSDVSSCSEHDNEGTLNCDEKGSTQIAETQETLKNCSNLDWQSDQDSGIAMKPDVCESTVLGCEIKKKKVQQEESLQEDQYSNISSPELERETSILKEEGQALKQDLCIASESVSDHVLETQNAGDGPLNADKVHEMITETGTTPSNFQNVDGNVDRNMGKLTTDNAVKPTEEVLQKTSVPTPGPQDNPTSLSPQTETVQLDIDNGFKKGEDDCHVSSGLEMEHSSFEFLETCLKKSENGLKSSCNPLRTSESTDLSVCEEPNEVLPEQRCATQEPPRQNEQEAVDSVADSMMLGTCNSEPQGILEAQKDNVELSGVVTEQEGNIRKTESSLNENESHHVVKVVRLIDSHNMKRKLDPVVVLDYKEQNDDQVGIYRCTQCSGTADSVNHLIEHHHLQHSKLHFQLCQACGCYLTSCQLAEHHRCEPNERVFPQPGQHWSSEDSQKLTKKANVLHHCRYCPLRFRNFDSFRMHERKHVAKSFRCHRCGEYYSQTSSLNRHLRLNRCLPSGSVSEVLEREGIPQPMKRMMKTSVKTSHGTLRECFVKLVDVYRRDPVSLSNTCKICNKSFKLRAQHNAHMRTHSDEKPHECKDCSKTFKYSWNLNKHRRERCGRIPKMCNEEQSAGSPYKQEQEPEDTAQETSASSLSTVAPRYKCPLCPRVFKYSYNLFRHLRLQCLKEYTKGDGKGKTASGFKCPLCGVLFTLVCNLGRHIKNICFPQYKVKGILKMKQEKKSDRLEGKSKPIVSVIQKSPNGTYFKCKLCPAVYAHYSGLSKHSRKHRLFAKTGKPVGYRTANPDDLKVSSYSEERQEEKSFDTKKSHRVSCRFCGKLFTGSLSLKKHMSLHKGDKPFSCQQCGKKFKKHAYLIAHTHAHKRKVQCSVCKKIFPTIADLLQHRQSHDNKGMLKCPDCSMEFKFPVYLFRHLVTHDKQKETSQAKKATCKPVQEPPEKLKSPLTSKEEFRCCVCHKSFVDAKGLSDHCLSHLPKESSLKCPFCKRNFSSRPALIRHIRLHTGEKPFPCKKCGKCFQRQEPLTTHMEHCKEKVAAAMKKCDKKDTPKAEPKEVKRVLHKAKKQFKCSYCPQSFLWTSSLTKHLNGHKLKLLAPCSKCGRCYWKTILDSHEKTCSGKDSNTVLLFPCKNCGKTFSRADNRNVHERKCDDTALPTNLEIKKSSQNTGTVPKGLPFKCPHCPKSFKYRSYLLKHLPSHLAEKPYACMHCGHKYASQRRYLQHEAFCDGIFRRKSASLLKVLKTEPTPQDGMAKMETDGQYPCKFCNKNFSKARNLRRHILTHTDVKPYRCKVCDSGFSRHDHLKVHQNRCKGSKQKLEVRVAKISPKLVGTGWQNSLQIKQEETFQCNTCSKQFSSQKNVARHTSLVHTSNKPFSCKRCGSSFSSLPALKKHTLVVKCKRPPPSPKVTEQQCRETAKLLQRIRGHYSDKFKFQCAYCPRRFKDRGQVQVHTRLHTGERPYGCENCGERFIRRDYLQRHLVKCTSKGEATERALCDRCGQLFPQEALQSHKSNCVANDEELKNKIQAKFSPPTKARTFSCTNCSETFLLFSQLQQHFLSKHREDTSQKPYDVSKDVSIKKETFVEEYDEAGPVQNDVDSQIDDKKPYPCPHCPMRFVNNSGLGMHIRIHTAEYPHSCRKCNKGFWNKKIQQRHLRKCVGKTATDQNSLSPVTNISKEPVSKEKSAVLVFNKGSNTTGTGVLQTKFSCKDGNKKLLRNLEQSTGHDDLSDKANMAANKYQCSECDQSFTDGLMLISHLENHGREDLIKGKKLPCNICYKDFDKAGALSRHMSIQHGIKSSHTCEICLKSFRFPSDVDIHKSCHDPNRPFCCSSCDLRFWSQKSLNQHVTMSHHKDESYTCHSCNKTYLTKQSYVRHNRLKHSKGLGTNSDHDKGDGSSVDQFDIEVNIDEESDVSDVSDVKDENDASEDDSDSAPYFPCHVCGKTFSTSESLEDHQRCHLGEKPHECEECGKCFFQLVNLQQHQRSHKSEFQCQTCGRGFVSLFALRKHKHSHGKNRPHRCSKCHLSFTGPSQLAEHMATHREENFPCDLCDHTFSCKISRAEHRRIHSEQEEELPSLIPPSNTPPLTSSSSGPGSGEQMGAFKYRCGVCNMRFRDPEQLSEHGCKATKERPYACPCDKHFLHGTHLKKHQLSHQLSGPYRYQCNQCHMNFIYRHHFLSHLKRHGNEKESADAAGGGDELLAESGNPDNIYQCPICPQSYSQAMELADHLTIHSFLCKVCNVTFPTKTQLTDHEQSHFTATTQYECTECGESFLGSDAFRQHQCAQRQRSHTENGPAPRLSSPTSLKQSSRSSRADEEEDEEEVDVGEDFYNCPVCKKRFSSQADLGEHQRIHLECRPYKCRVCDKGFAKRRYLNKHQLIHERPFRCDDCPQSFVTKSSLLAHQRIHVNREFQCSVCQKCYTTAQELLRHEKKHAEKQDKKTGGAHRCDMCYKSFGHLSLLKKHQESHVGEVVYECTECDKAFAAYHLLEEHRRTHIAAASSTDYAL